MKKPTLYLGAAPFLLGALAWLAAAGGCGGTTDDRPAKWSYIYATIVQPSCATANCHSVLTSRSGVELSGMRQAYDRLVLGQFVRRGEPECSELMRLLRAQSARRMPPTFALANADIALIERWIEAGAPYDGPGGQPDYPDGSLPATPSCAASGGGVQLDAGAGGGG